MTLTMYGFLALKLIKSLGCCAYNTKLIRSRFTEILNSPIKRIRKFLTRTKLALVKRSFSLQASITNVRSILGLQAEKRKKGHKCHWLTKKGENKGEENLQPKVETRNRTENIFRLKSFCCRLWTACGTAIIISHNSVLPVSFGPGGPPTIEVNNRKY